MDEQLVKRINELSRIAKSRKLTIDEQEERQELRRKYINAFKNNFKNQMDNVYIKEEDGTVTKLTDK